MSRYFDPDTTAWLCRCGHWNKVESVACAKCEGQIDFAVRGFRVDRRLSPAEETFFTIVAPRILTELERITDELRRLNRK